MTISRLLTHCTLAFVCAIGVACSADADSGEMESAGETGETGGDGDGDGDGDGEGDFPPELLNCPIHGPLPFSPQSDTFQNPANATLVMDLPRFKDEASDVLGNPDGPYAYTRVDVDTPANQSQLRFAGNRGRTGDDMGLLSTPIPGEFVSLWTFDGSDWSERSRVSTDAEGDYEVTGVSPSPNNFQPVYAVLEGDGSCAAHYTFLLNPGTKVILSDIDGTLTASDDELFSQIADVNYDPLEKGSASALANAWADKGYQMVYLTARPHLFRAETRGWLRDHNFPVGPVITANSLTAGSLAVAYKGAWVSRLLDDLGWDIYTAYGNATSDIDGYAQGGIPKDVTFIIGENAGVDGTQPIADDDYAQHIQDYVLTQPDAG